MSAGCLQVFLLGLFFEGLAFLFKELFGIFLSPSPLFFFFFFLTIYDVLSKFFFINLGGKEEKKRTSTETFVCPNIDTDLAK